MHPPRKSLTSLRHPAAQQKGYLLIETLVTIAILAVGLLGVAAMQMTSLKSGFSAVQRGEAGFLVGAMSDRMRANTSAVYAGNYADLSPTSNFDINAAVTISSAAQRAQYDFDVWRDEINRTFNANTAPVGSITCDSAANCILEINWSDTRADSSLQDSSAFRYKHIVSVVF